ncbi:uncharacterized protein LOC111049532 [Nilaparvata lugens]|uniref:uncharacterized protein LOC111049532 n=1 Tax=Nilaparvata lugens TaxID=108931 RepID=UPI00193E60AF|nr:uncharacterized protein LOC111049532 [Nilaparvata lugens]
MLIIHLAELHASPSSVSSGETTIEKPQIFDSHYTLAIFKSLAKEDHRQKRQACRGSDQCDTNQWCYQNRCEYPCPEMDCPNEVSPQDGICIIINHQPRCVDPFYNPNNPLEVEEFNLIPQNY